MRISGGKARGVSLRVSKQSVHRPAMDKLRQSIFSSIASWVHEANVCDLFAGTGSYGLEALSRGASSATFVEMNRKACSMIKENIAIVAKSMRSNRLDTKVIPKDATKFALESGEPFELIIADPPYDIIEEIAEKLFKIFDILLAPDGLIVFEMPGQLNLQFENWTLRKRIGKGIDQPTACIYERGPPCSTT